MRHLLIFVGVITGFYAIVSSYDNRYDLTTVFASISLLSFIGAAQFDPDKKLEDILENLDEEPNLQPVVQKQQKKSTGSPNFQNERLNFLINNFQTYISKPFPNKYLNPNDPFFDDFYTTIARIKGYDFRCGYEKENQLLDKIKTHNEVILNKLETTKTHPVIGVNYQTSIITNSVQKEDLRSHNLSTHSLNSKQELDVQNESRFQEETLKSLIDNFEAYISKPFPNKHLSPDDLSLCDFYINRIKEYDSECGREKEKQLLEKIKAHNEIISSNATQASSAIGFDSKTSKERLNSLIDSFEAYISKPFPDKHLNSNDSFFDDFYSLINRIKGYDFKCGHDKEKQLLEKIKTHNETIAISKTTSIQDEKLISLIKNFQSAISRPFPNKYLSGKDSFFNDFYNMLDEIRNYDLNFSIINQKKLLEKIQLHNEKITGLKSIESNAFNKYGEKTDRDSFVSTDSVELEDDIDEILDSVNFKFHPLDVLQDNKAEQPVVRKEPKFKSLVTSESKNKIIGKVDTKSLINKFRDSISVQFPDKYFDIDESFFEDFKKQLTEIERYCGHSTREEWYNQLLRRIEWHNNYFIASHLNDPIFSNICGYSLDNEQRKAILRDSKHNLVVAGAGTGKTLTICGKIKYLLENNLAKENEILLMSYSKDSVDDINKKVAQVSAKMKAKTFHSLGNAILTEHYGEKKAIEDQILSHIKAFFEERLSSDTKFTRKIFKYFSCYIRSIAFDFRKKENDEEEQDWTLKKPYRTLKEALKSLNKDPKNNVTAKKEYVRSVQELVIANFLFVNGIEYEYEKPYEINTATLDRRRYCPDFYLPKYKIYIEHYGIDKDGRARQYSYNEEQDYLEGINWKRKIHRENHTTCIETYSYEFSNGKIFTNLKKKLEEKGVEFKPLTAKQVKETLSNLYEGHDFSKFMDVLATFLDLYKSKFRDNTKFDSFVFGTGYERQRTTMFLEISKEIYDYYTSLLKENDKIDFDDMILQSTDFLDLPKFRNKYRYKYILVDEFQDISQSRFNLLKKLVEHGDSKLMVVGDDWQSIYRFNGSDINIFVDFNKTTFPDATVNYITTTHRNSAELQEIAGTFIMKNPRQFKKQIKSDKHLQDPVRIITYKGYDNSSDALKQALGEISRIDSSAEVLILGRTNEDINKKFQSETNHAFPNLKISYKTIHGSKGLESDFVILINAGNIPNKIMDDPIINRLLAAPEGFMFAEERRLFYVALTRTKSVVYILMQEEKPSLFVGEIKKYCEQTEAKRHCRMSLEELIESMEND